MESEREKGSTPQGLVRAKSGCGVPNPSTFVKWREWLSLGAAELTSEGARAMFWVKQLATST